MKQGFNRVSRVVVIVLVMAMLLSTAALAYTPGTIIGSFSNASLPAPDTWGTNLVSGPIVNNPVIYVCITGNTASMPIQVICTSTDGTTATICTINGTGTNIVNLSLMGFKNQQVCTFRFKNNGASSTSITGWIAYAV